MVRLNQLPDRLDDLTYPLSIEELSAVFEGQTLVHPGGEEPVSAVVDRCGSDVIESANDAWLSVMASVDEAAVGRKFYTDRDPPCSPAEFDPVSF